MAFYAFGFLWLASGYVIRELTRRKLDDWQSAAATISFFIVGYFIMKLVISWYTKRMLSAYKARRRAARVK